MKYKSMSEDISCSTAKKHYVIKDLSQLPGTIWNIDNHKLNIDNYKLNT